MKSTKHCFLLTAFSFIVLAMTVPALPCRFDPHRRLTFADRLCLHRAGRAACLQQYRAPEPLPPDPHRVGDDGNHLAAGRAVLLATRAGQKRVGPERQPRPDRPIRGPKKGSAINTRRIQDTRWHSTSEPAQRDTNQPPHFAIWLENASHYHIKTLKPDDLTALPYWDFKRRGWETAKSKAEASGKDLAEELDVDGVSGATQNSSFDPADYILPTNTDESLPYRLLIEIDQPNDDQASLVYAVDIDNADPRTFQLLDLVGYPKREEDDQDGKEVWALYYVDGNFTTALELIDSALLTIERDQ